MQLQQEIITAQKSQVTPPKNGSSQPVIIDSIRQPVIIQPQQPLKVDIPPQTTSPWNSAAIAISATVIGSVLGAVGVWFTNKIQYHRQREQRLQEERRSNTIALWKEFNSESLSKDRTDAYKAFAVDRQENAINARDIVVEYENINKVTDEAQRNAKLKELLQILRVINFYEGLDIFKQYDKLDEDMAKALFSVIYTRWFDKCFQHQIVSVLEHDNWKNTHLCYCWLYDEEKGEKTQDECQKIMEKFRKRDEEQNVLKTGTNRLIEPVQNIN